MRRGCSYRPIRSAMGLVVLGALVCSTMVHAQLTYPWNVGCAQPIMDEFGSPLQGVAGQGGDRIEMIIASNGVIEPPAVDGSPSMGHHLFYATAIGNLVSPNGSIPDCFPFPYSMPPVMAKMCSSGCLTLRRAKRLHFTPIRRSFNRGSMSE